MKVFAIFVISLFLLASMSPALAFGGPVAAPAPKKATTSTRTVTPAQNTQPEVTNDTGNAQDVAKQRRKRRIVVALITGGVIVGAIAASGGSSHSGNSGTSGTTGTVP